MDNEKQIDLFNSLIEINSDRIEGYKAALKATEDLDLINLFTQLIKTSQSCKSELVYEVRRMGGIPMEPKPSGKFVKLWTDLKAAMDSWNRKAILNLLEYGEDYTADMYNSALRDNIKHISADQQALLNAQHVLIKKDHTTVKELRDKMKVS